MHFKPGGPAKLRASHTPSFTAIHIAGSNKLYQWLSNDNLDVHQKISLTQHGIISYRRQTSYAFVMCGTDSICLCLGLKQRGLTHEQQAARNISHETLHVVLYREHGTEECRKLDNIAYKLRTHVPLAI